MMYSAALTVAGCCIAIRAEAFFEKVANATMLELTDLNLKQIVRGSEQPETGIA